MGESREPRSSVILYGAVETLRGKHDVRVRNLSRLGACIGNDGKLRAGERLFITMGTLSSIPATVIWATAALAGIRFVRPADLERARQPRGTKIVPNAGWMTDINNAYRRDRRG